MIIIMLSMAQCPIKFNGPSGKVKVHYVNDKLINLYSTLFSGRSYGKNNGNNYYD